MSLNTDLGDAMYGEILPAFVGELRKLAPVVESQGNPVAAAEILDHARDLEKCLEFWLKHYPAGTMMPSASEGIIDVINKILNGSLRIDSTAGKDISDSSDVKTAVLQKAETKDKDDPSKVYVSFACIISKLKNKIGGIRGLLINHYDPNNIRFKYLVIPKEIIPKVYDEENDKMCFQDSLNITVDPITFAISFDSAYHSCEATFYEYCMLPETGFIHHYNMKETIKKGMYEQNRNEAYAEAVEYLEGNPTATLTEMLENTVNRAIASFYSGQNSNEHKIFTESQKEDLQKIAAINKTRKEELKKGPEFQELMEIVNGPNCPQGQIELMRIYKGDPTLESTSWFTPQIPGDLNTLYFGAERTQTIINGLAANKTRRRIAEFEEQLEHFKRVNPKSINQYIMAKHPNASRLKGNYANGKKTFYYENAVPDWKEQFENAIQKVVVA